MSYKINITNAAAGDLAQIYEYIEKICLLPKLQKTLIMKL